MAITGAGRVRRTTALGDCTILTTDTSAGPRDLVVKAVADHRAARSATADLRRIQWVRLHLDAETPHARLAGTTRRPQIRTITVPAALALVERGLPAFVSGEGD